VRDSAFLSGVLDLTGTRLADFGVSRSIDLVPGGSEIPVTNDNRMQYIVLVSNYRLNVQIAPQCRAFYQGLFEIINPRWLHMFNQSELAVLVGAFVSVAVRSSRSS
jgi:ubiquitin-protein ligase E3 C